MTSVLTRPRRGLQVPTDTYEKDGRRITLVGVSHVADAQFWESTRGVIAEHEAAGAEVHYEMVKNDIEGPQPRPFGYKEVAEALNLESQHTGITIGESWLNTDMRLSDMMAHATRNTPPMLEREQIDSAVRFIGGTRRRRTVARGVISFFIPLLRAIPLPGPSGVPSSVILGQRNEIAAKAALAAEGDVVAIWGAAHLSGIGRVLKRNGFTRTSRSWSTAITIQEDAA